MATVTIASLRGPEKVIPYSAVIYDNALDLTYVNTAPRTSRASTRSRHPGHVAILGGPRPGSGGDGGPERSARSTTSAVRMNDTEPRTLMRDHQFQPQVPSAAGSPWP
jgi:hypothetical protein